MSMVPESRRTQGLILVVLDRKYFTSLFKKFLSLYGLNKKQERNEVDAICNKTTVKHSGMI